MTDWYYARGGQQFGPFPLSKLQELASAGDLDPVSDLVWNQTLPEWTPAGQVNAIYPAAPAPASPLPASPLPAATTAVPVATPESQSSVPAAQVPVAAPNRPGSTGAVKMPVSSRDPFLNPYATPGTERAAAAVPAKTVAPVAGSLAEILPGSAPFDVFQVIGRGFKVALRHFGFIFLAFVVYFAILAVLYGLLYALDSATGWEMVQNGENVGFSPWSQAISNVVSLFFTLGLTRIGLNLISGKPVAVGQLFGEGDKLLRAIGASILYMLMIFGGMLLLIFPGIYLAIRYGQYLNAIVDQNMGIMESFRYSASITLNNKFRLFGLWLMSIVVILGGILALGVGIFVAAPTVWLMYLVAYRWMQFGAIAVEDQPGTTQPALAQA